MSQPAAHSIAEETVNKALDLGADIAGIAAWSDIAAGPSYQIQPYLKSWSGISGQTEHLPADSGSRPGSVLVVGIAHPATQMELDWWQANLPRRTLGNDLLAGITGGVADWLGAQHGVKAWDMPYFPGRGGVYLKDAAVLAGLGCVGRNNLFITPEHGPRIRLRAAALELALPSSGATGFDPCHDCDAPCRRVCPQGALSEPWLGGLEAPVHLPARDGSYDRARCNDQMEADIAAHCMIAPPGSDQPSKQVRYCRRCELACVAGRDSKR